MEINKNNLIIIGLDGCTWDILIPMVKNGYMPSLKKLVDQGVYGQLKSTIPPVTGGAWLSLATGKTPGKTGKIDFLNKKDNENFLLPIHSKDFKSLQPFWKYIEEEGLKIGIFNYPLLFPPYEINGFMVSGIGCSSKEIVSFPRLLKKELEVLTGKAYKIAIDYHKEKYSDLEIFTKEVDEFIEIFEQYVLYIINIKHIDFLMLIFSVTDWVQHRMWHLLDKTHPFYDSKLANKWNKWIIDFWKKIDKIINNILKNIDNSTSIMLVSDHGFGPNTKSFNLAIWLEKKGYLFRQSKNHNKINNFINKSTGIIAQTKIAKAIPNKVRKNFYGKFNPQISYKINFNKSKAFCLGHTIPFGGIYINKKFNDTENIKNCLIKDLQKLPQEINKDIDVTIFDTNKIYNGERVKNLPNIIFTIDEWSCIIKENIFKGQIFEEKPFSPRHTGSHRLNGIFLAYGKDIKKGLKLDNATIYDIAPTVLSYFDIPIPDDMDGKVLFEIYEKNKLIKNKLNSIKNIEKKKLKTSIRKLVVDKKL